MVRQLDENFRYLSIKFAIKRQEAMHMKKLDLNEVFTPSEAETVYGLAEGQIRQDIRRGKFDVHEHRKSSSNWLLTREGLDKVYKNKKNERIAKKIDLHDIYTPSEAETIYGLTQIRQDIRRGKFEIHEHRKSGRNWLLTIAALERVYEINKELHKN